MVVYIIKSGGSLIFGVDRQCNIISLKPRHNLIDMNVFVNKLLNG